MRRIAILRPEPGASETLARATALGLDAFHLPLFATEKVHWTLPELHGIDGVLVTSANALRLAGDKLEALAHLPVFAVGEATASAARACGLAVAKVGSGGIAALLGDLDPGLRLLHLAGEDRTDPMPERRVTAVTVYRSRFTEPGDELEKLRDCVALVHSPRAARRLGALVDGSTLSRAEITIVAISLAAATAAGDGWAQAVSSPAVTDEALLALAAELCKMMGTP